MQPRSRASIRRVRVANRSIDGWLAPLRDNPAETAVLLDFDGTLAAITRRPTSTTLAPATRSVLRRLQVRYEVLGIVTGRHAEDARRRVGLDIEYAGNHGMETLRPGTARAVLDPAVAAWRPAIRAFAAAECGAALTAAGVRIEDKDVVITLHWRGARDEALAQRTALAAADVAVRQGLRIQGGRGVVEIRPPVAIDKGTAVRRILDAHPGVRHVVYAGDDLTDVDAMRELGTLKASGRLSSVVRVGVWSREMPQAVRDASDIVVRGPRGVRRLLRRLDPGIRGPHLPLAV